MQNSFSFKNHFVHKFYYYVAAAIVIPTALSVCIDFKLRAKDFEKFSIYIAEYNVNMKAFQDKLSRTFGDGIVEYNIYHVNPDGVGYADTYVTQGYSSDIMILPEQAIVENDMQYFLPLPTEYQNENNYVINEKQIGFMMFDGESGYLSDYINYQNKKYYMFINTSSVHLSEIAEGDYKTNCVHKLLKEMTNV